MKRRSVLTAGLGLASAAALRLRPANAAAVSRVRPGAPGWPADTDWAGLKEAVGGRLAPVSLPNLADPDVRKLLANPFYVADQVGLTQSSGWLDAWRSAPSAYAVAAESAADIAAAVRFARAHNLRLAIKGRGHSYLGASNAPDSLLIWTRAMDGVRVDGPLTGALAGVARVAARRAQAVTVGAGRYMQGGGCTTVGVAGLLQGGGFGSYSKGFGTAAASLLEAEIVTADGQVRVVNRVKEPELFWALKGGGGGTFGVVTRLTLATHELPQTFGAVRLEIRAHSNEAYRRLLARFVDLYATGLCNPHWGEQARAGPDNRLEVSMVFQGLTQEAAGAAFKPLIDFANAGGADYEGQHAFLAFALPARRFWDGDFMRQIPTATHPDARPSAPSSDFWWSGDGDQVCLYWHAFTSAWLPASLLKPANQARLVDAWFAASRHQEVSFHFNKGLAGAPAAALAATRDTATNPEVTEAFALAIIADGGGSLFAGSAANPTFAHASAGRVQDAMKALRACAPGAGAYVNECDYFQADWQKAFWGPNYPRLLRVKHRYDPDGLFTVHHGVGGEAWSADGFTRTG